MRVGRGLRELGASGREAHAVVEGERARRDERGDLTERVTARTRRASSGSGASASHDDERREQHRELRFTGARERFGGRVGDEVRERLTERGFGLLDDLPAGWSRHGAAMPGCWVP